LLPAKADSGNCLALYGWPFKTFTPTKTDRLASLQALPFGAGSFTPRFAFLGGNRP
jgi:hypothetical protein